MEGPGLLLALAFPKGLAFLSVSRVTLFALTLVGFRDQRGDYTQALWPGIPRTKGLSLHLGSSNKVFTLVVRPGLHRGPSKRMGLHRR